MSLKEEPHSLLWRTGPDNSIADQQIFGKIGNLKDSDETELSLTDRNFLEELMTSLNKV